MSTFDWETFLRQWSFEVIESRISGQEVPLEVLESRWLGYPGATEEQLAQAEARLGMALPHSYREFLRVSNGWRQTTPFITRLWSTAEIDWFPVRHQAWITEFTAQFGDRTLSRHPPMVSRNGHHRSLAGPPPDDDYLIYGEAQDCLRLRVGDLQNSLEISEKGDASIYLLNPQVVAADGEWEAWFFGDWLPGADRYPSFQDLMQAEYANFRELREAS